MKPLINYNNICFTAHFKYIWTLLATIASLCLLSSCDKDNLEIQKGFPFEVSVMPVPKEISNRQTIEIRLMIKRAENYIGTQYFIRYFQYDGQGTLQYYNELPYLPNDLYPLPAEQFRLYYTSQANVTHSFTIWISDNFGNEKQLNFQINTINR
ncbi:DUF3872 domain-containing protein [Flavobacterium plurextorum]|uniref:Conjugal transfer protein TraQ n=1 Tax=Flavobacterium oncorhynchi TaxID=728056 RepID=A0A226HYF3_9FLAO|nr:DUF3872 domain-containing protein [Flavobacterium oncorhynchi]OXA99154.1 conjugal transfer protein TraQ [Flavobacterium oncorhynchi]